MSRTAIERLVFRPAQHPCPGSRITRQMHPDVARALGLEIVRPEPIVAQRRAVTKVKPMKWSHARFIPMVGFVNERKGARV